MLNRIWTALDLHVYLYRIEEACVAPCVSPAPEKLAVSERG